MGRLDENETCSVARSLGVLGERWTFLIVREAFFGATRFAEFRERLGVAPDVLSARLATLVKAGVMEKVPYRDPGSRVRDAYELTPAGRELSVILGALQTWGDRHLPRPEGPSVLRRRRDDGRPVRVAFVDEDGREVPPEAVEVIPNPALRQAAGPPRA
jgi:DNA-binding HxlR family transcriptional regulator